MDVRFISLDLAGLHVRAVIADAHADRTVDLHGGAAQLVFAAAGPLVAELARRAGRPVLTVTLDFVAGTAAATAAALLFHSLAGLPALRETARAVIEATAPPPMPRATTLDAAFWDGIYRKNRDGWELGRPAPPLARVLGARPPAGKHVLVAGCGRGHEARLAASLGAHVTAVDISPVALAEAEAWPSPASAGSIRWREADLFALPALESERYDIVLEHCCFCAIDPVRRQEFALTMAELLVPGGELIGLFWNHGRPGGPPFTVDAPELRRLFEPAFVVDEIVVPPDSVATRTGHELLARFRKN